MKWIKTFENFRETAWSVSVGDKLIRVTISQVMDHLDSEGVKVEKINLEELIPLVSRIGDSSFDTSLRSWDSSLEYPIIVASLGGKIISVLDGHHRVMKAYNSGRDSILARILALECCPEEWRKLFERIVPAILLDGVSSAGKSYFSKCLVELGWVVIGSDDFGGDSERKIAFDHSGEGFDPTAGEKFHKKCLSERGEDLGGRGRTNVAWDGHPKNSEFVEIGLRDPRVWYMWEDYLWGRGAGAKGVVFDDISDEILKCFRWGGLESPKHVVIYASPDQLVKNVISRWKVGDARGSFVFSEQFVYLFGAVYDVGESIDPGHSYTADYFRDLFLDEELVRCWKDCPIDVEKFLKDLGVSGEETFWIGEKRGGGEIFLADGLDCGDFMDFLDRKNYIKLI